MSSFNIIVANRPDFIVANCPDFSTAMSKALTLALNRYNDLRDQLNHWANAHSLIKLEYATEGHGFILSYNDNPSMTTRMKREVYKVVDATAKR